jgi:hypothetical protein
MADHISELELNWRIRPGGEGKTRRDYLDFVVDGQSLQDLLQLGDSVGCLGWLPPKHERSFRDALLLKGSFVMRPGRYILYICPECGDIGCGAITARIEKGPDSVTWRDFGLENPHYEVEGYLERYQHVGPFQFDEAKYRSALTRL